MEAHTTPVAYAREEPAAASSPVHEPLRVAALPLIGENPYQQLLYGELEAYEVRLAAVELKFRALWLCRRKVDVLHFHWPQDYYSWWRRPVGLRRPLSWLVKLPLFAMRIATARALGYLVVWTIHEVLPHERPDARLDRIASSLLARASALLLAHDQGTAELAARELNLGRRRVEIVPHGPYVGVYRPRRARDTVREELGISQHAFVFLCFGHLRAYKDVGVLLEAFRIAALPGARLVVAGLPLDNGVADEVRAAASDDPRIIAILDFVPDECVAELFAAADVAALPRGDGGTSGALVLALSLGLPVIAAATRDYAELTGGNDSGWLFAAGDAASLAQALTEAAEDPEVARARGAAARARADGLSWSAIAERTADLLRSAAAGSRR